VVWWACLLGVFVFVVPHDVHGGLVVAIMVGLVALAFAPMGAVARWHDGRRVARVAGALSRDAFAVSRRPADGERRTVLEELGELARLRNGQHVSWIAHKSIRGREVTVLRHHQLAGAKGFWHGDTSIVVAMPSDDPRPGVWLIRTNATMALRDAAIGGEQDLRFGDAWFDRNFRIHSRDPDSLTRILTPAVRELIATGPAQESWTIGYGYVICVFGADTTARGIGVMIERTHQLVELISAEAAHR
jgi:hypothetical protein